MFLRKKIAVKAAVFALVIGCASAKADVFIGAHPDDIELFMNKNASTDVYTGVPTVFIVLTAGDAGNGSGGLNRHSTPYYRSRLMAHEYAVRYWVSLVGGEVNKTVATTRTFGTHSIEKATVGNVTIYNFKLPDGGDGGGYAATGFKSLTKLFSQQITSISSVDNTNSYTLADLKATLRLIISAHSAGVSDVWVNVHDNDGVYNSGTHPDQLATANITLAAISEVPAYQCINRALYQDYNIAGLSRFFVNQSGCTAPGAARRRVTIS